MGVGLSMGLRQMITQDQIKDLFEYRDGVLYWKVKPPNGVNKHLGYFDDIDVAAQILKIERVKYHGEFANHG